MSDSSTDFTETEVSDSGNENVEEKKDLEELAKDTKEEKENKDEGHKMTKEGWVFVILLIVFEILVAFGLFIFVKNGQDNHIASEEARIEALNSTEVIVPEKDTQFDQYYKVYIDVCIMIYLGFGLLMNFLKKHGFYALGMSFLAAAVASQIAFFAVGYTENIYECVAHYIEHSEFHFQWYVVLDFPMVIKSLFAGGAVLISLGVVIGKFTPSQLIISALLEVIVYSINVTIVELVIGISDVGGSVLVHSFGAYFGVFMSWVYRFGKKHDYKMEGSVKISDIISLTGTIVLWILWPSFNGALEEDYRHRVFINTYLSLAGCCISAFICSRFLRKKFELEDLQNATLAGGVAIGSTANMMMWPGIPTCVGILAGCISVCGYTFIGPALLKYAKLHDSCGVNNLHGMPGILGALVSVLVVILNGVLVDGNYVTALVDAGRQFGGLAFTLAFSAFFGSLVGGLMRFVLAPKEKEMFDDAPYFEVVTCCGLDLGEKDEEKGDIELKVTQQ